MSQQGDINYLGDENDFSRQEKARPAEGAAPALGRVLAFPCGVPPWEMLAGLMASCVLSMIAPQQGAESQALAEAPLMLVLHMVA